MKNVKFWVSLCVVMIAAMFCQCNAAAQNNQEQLLYERINSYLVKKQYREAENALDTAISRYPTNLVLYIVKSGIYVGKYTALKKDYKVVLDKI